MDKCSVCVCVCVQRERACRWAPVPPGNKFCFYSERFSGFLSLQLFCFSCLTTFLWESVQIILCLCAIGPGRPLKFVCLWCFCAFVVVVECVKMGGKVRAYFCVRTRDSRWRMGRQDGAGDDEWGDRQRRIALYPSVTIPLSLSLSSLSLPVGMMQCLLFCGSEEEKDGGKMGRRWKEKKNCIHPQSMFTSTLFLLLSSHPLPLLLPLSFHFHHLFSPPSPSLHPPLCWSESVVSIVSFGVIQLLLLLFFPVSHCFFSPFLSYQKNSSRPDTHFHT